MLAGLDPYTEYYPEQKTEELSLMTTGEYGGIGSLIRQRNNEGGVMIAEPTEGMPADLAGLKPGDLILAIDRSMFPRRQTPGQRVIERCSQYEDGFDDPTSGREETPEVRDYP